MPADSGDTVPETVKRNVRDTEQGETEQSKDAKNNTRKEEEKEIKRSTAD